jgi:hypothetical protein
MSMYGRSNLVNNKITALPDTFGQGMGKLTTL